MSKHHSWDTVSPIFDTPQQRNQTEDKSERTTTWPYLFSRIDAVRNGLTCESCSILDYGCGTGALAQALHLMGYRVAGYDPSPEMIRRAASWTHNSIAYSSTSFNVYCSE